MNEKITTITNRTRLPDDYIEIGKDIMTNFDHTIDEEIAEEIKGKKVAAAYPAYNFHGTVWWMNGKWWCEVWCHHTYQQTYMGDALEDLMDAISSEYGYK